ncbi:MAG TPA: M23 family metallopeptidase [Candidatus Hydrogenedentes bacterium]|nr:M23 family metallopeptidase [Candidatus Hydrogenedentota bacterium]HQM48524.1 M23 family metallopeptidase [Candidatus Hydrogenedentota bacterium]
MTTLFLLFTCLASEEPYQWPLELPPAVTSSFAEYRSGRFHAGIDLRTGGTGPEVYAAADGYVSRIRCGPWGYGKAVYLRDGGGRTFVYGHLAEFSSSLRDYVRRAQHARESYTVDLMPEPGEFRVKRGELIALAGRSGTRVPHLHWEVRDEQSRPLNPRLLDISWPDDTRPIIRKVLIVPKGTASAVNGDVVPVVLEARADSAAGSFACASVTARGEIGIAVDVIDPANGGSTVLGVHTVTTSADSREVFRVQNDRLSYETMSHGRVSWHPYYLSEGRFLLQWRWPGNDSDNFALSESSGWIEVGDKPRDVRIEARDFFGHSAVLPLRVEAGMPVPEEPVARGSGAPGTVKVDCFGEGLLVTAQFPDAEPETPVARCIGMASGTEAVFRRVGPGLFRAVVEAGSGSDDFSLSVEHPRLTPYLESFEVFERGAGRVAEVDDLVIRSDARSPYGTLYLRVSKETVTASPGLVVMGEGYRLWPADAPLDVPLEISFPQPAGAYELSQVHIYSKSGSGWVRQETGRSGGRLTVAASSLGVFAPMADTMAPAITAVHPTAENTVTTSARPEIRARVTDNASGIADVQITANGKWLLAEYDPFDSPAATITWLRDEDLPLGENEIVIRAVDGAGNVTVVSRRLRIDEEPAGTP